MMENPYAHNDDDGKDRDDDFCEGCFCIDCGDTFRLDDIGGYNPPCSCGMHCRHCHEFSAHRYDDDDDNYPDDSTLDNPDGAESSAEDVTP